MRSARLFTAAAFTPQEKRELEAVQRVLNGHCVSGRLVRPELMHITLHFFGQTDLARVGAIEQAMRDAAAEAPPFTLTTGRAGTFARAGGAGVLWLGLDEGAQALRALQAALDRELAAQGFAPEGRPFQAHITLARDARLTDDLAGVALPKVSLAVNAITLMESTQAKGYLEYVPLLSVPLGGK